MPSRGFVYILPQEYISGYPDHSFHVYKAGSIPQRMGKGFDLGIDCYELAGLR